MTSPRRGGHVLLDRPEQDLIGIFMIQIRPNRDVNFRDQFKRLVYQAVID